MSRVGHYGHGIYCYVCQEVYEGTNSCDHPFERKDGVRKGHDGYFAQPEDMGHYGPHHFVDIDGMEQCAECGRVNLPTELVE